MNFKLSFHFLPFSMKKMIKNTKLCSERGLYMKYKENLENGHLFEEIF